MTSTQPESASPTYIWVLVVALASVVVALVAAILMALTGAGPADAALLGGKAFATAFALGLAVLSAIRSQR
jgi:hypothetical protein